MMDFGTFANLLYLFLAEYFPEEVDPSLKPIDSAGCIPCRDIEFDFIIVGAGSAGSVVANRLSANPDYKVLLLEVGTDETYITDTPALEIVTESLEPEFHFKTVKQERSCLSTEGICTIPGGKRMGGGSAVNYMVYVRGNKEDYNGWERLGNIGWGYDDVLPYFLRAENNTIPELARSPYHSTQGPLTVGYSVYTPPIDQDFIDAGKEYGLQEVDYNGAEQVGVGKLQATLRGPTRCSSSKAYLDPIRDRPNLYIFKNTIAIKILFDESGKRAIGVRCVTDGEEFDVFASKEVILSAGGINTPKLLMLSGVGPKEHLEALDIPVVADLPVGQNFMDHPGPVLSFKINTTAINCCGEFTIDTIKEYAKDRKGELTYLDLRVMIFLSSTGSKFPDLEIICGLTTWRFNSTEDPKIKLIIENVNPKALGSVKLMSKNYLDPPLVDPNYYGNKTDMDVMIWGVRQALKFMNMSSLAKYSPQWTPEVEASCDQPMESDAFFECFIKQKSEPHYHVSCSTRMGPVCDKSAVIDPTLKVHGIDGLRIVDNSIMPHITKGNTNGIAIMIGEKGADLILQDYGCIRK